MKCGYVALVGEPNVGKSTLVNAMVGQKLSIVSDKPQTTRQRVLGIYNDERAQVIFLDTPGHVAPKYRLHERMMSFIGEALVDADVVVFLADATSKSPVPEDLEKRINREGRRKPVLYVLNKIDLVGGEAVEAVIKLQSGKHLYDNVLAVSALRGKGVEDLRNQLVGFLPDQEAFYPGDIISEHPERFFAAEFVREQVFQNFRDEIPYSTAVEIREYREREDRKTYIAADIIVERESQKGILIGKNGAALKTLGAAARREIEEFIGRPVYLELFVKVREKWRNKDHTLDRLGYKRQSS